MGASILTKHGVPQNAGVSHRLGRLPPIVLSTTFSLPTNKATPGCSRADLKADQPTIVTIRNRDTDGFVILDALQWVEVKD